MYLLQCARLMYDSLLFFVCIGDQLETPTDKKVTIPDIYIGVIVGVSIAVLILFVSVMLCIIFKRRCALFIDHISHMCTLYYSPIITMFIHVN